MKMFHVTLPDGRRVIEIERPHVQMGGGGCTWVYYFKGSHIDNDPRPDNGWQNNPIEGLTDRVEIDDPDLLLAELLS